MKSSYGRGMARGYERGRAHIRGLNRRNAERKDYYVALMSQDMETAAKAILGPMTLVDASNIAEQKTFGQDSDGRLYQNFHESEMIQLDPEGVARLKANPKL